MIAARPRLPLLRTLLRPAVAAGMAALVATAAVGAARPSHAAPRDGGDEVRPPEPDQTGPGIGTDELASRRRRLVEACGRGAVVCLIGKPADDLEEFFQSPDFYYLTGINEGGGAAALRIGPDGAYEEVLFLPARNRMQEQWDGPRLYPGASAQRQTGFAATAPKSRLGATLTEWLAGEGKSLWVAGTDGRTVADVLDRALPDVERKSARSRVHALRQIKSEAEVAIFTRAVEITGAALVEAMKSAAPKQGEWELEAVIEYMFRRFGAERFGFPSIVGSGPNSCVLHYNASTRRMKANELVVCDVGAEYRRYTADITRTFPVSGKWSPRQREIYEIVLRAQNEAMKAVRPGATIRSVHSVAQRVIREAGHGGRFPHGTSHWIGLEVHDVGDYSRRFEPGMILSVEPGIYIPEENIGVRIEDDVIVTRDGFVNLSEGCPRDPDEIERIMAEGGVGNARVAELTSPNARPEIRPERPTQKPPTRKRIY